MFCVLMWLFCYLEKCFCAKSGSCPTIKESDESVKSDGDKVCVYFCVLLCMFCCVVCLMFFTRIRMFPQVNESSSKILRYILCYYVVLVFSMCCVVGWLKRCR